MADKFMVNKAHLQDQGYGFYGFDLKTGSSAEPYLMIYTTPANQRRNSYPHITIYYKKIKDKTKETYFPDGGTIVRSQGQYFHISMSEYHYSESHDRKLGREFKGGVWKNFDMGTNIGLDEMRRICEQFERLLERKIKTKPTEADPTWDENGPGGNGDPVLTKGGVTPGSTPAQINGPDYNSWEDIPI